MKLLSAIVGALGLCVACGSGDDVPCDPSPAPAIVDVEGLRLERMYAVATPRRTALVGGLDDAADVGATVVVKTEAGGELDRAQADARGRFLMEVTAPVGAPLRVGLEDAAATLFTVRDPERGRTCAVRESLGGAGSVPNDLLVVGSAADPLGVVVRSGDNAVSPFPLGTGLDEASPGVRLPEVELAGLSRAASPWFAASLGADTHRVAVTAFGQRHVYVVDLDRGELERTIALTKSATLASPFVLARELDVDGDGTPERSVSSFVPRSPQPVLVSQGKLYVGFASFLSPRLGADRPPVYLPAVLAEWRLEALDEAPTLHVLEHQNVQELRASSDGRVWVVCSGAIEQVSGTVESLSPGAVLVFDPAQGAITETFELGDFLPGTAVWAGDALWVGSLARGRLLRIDPSTREMRELVLNDEAVDSVFRLVELPGGFIGVPSFNADRLHFLDPVTGALNPPPLFGPLAVGPGRPIFDGLQIVTLRPGRRGIDFVGPDLFALGGTASRITPIELRKIFGP